MKTNRHYWGARIRKLLYSLSFRVAVGIFLLILSLNIGLNWGGQLASTFFTGRSLGSLSRTDGFTFYGQTISLSISFGADVLSGLAWLILVALVLFPNWVKQSVGNSKMQTILALMVLATGGAFSLIFGGMVYSLIGAGLLVALILLLFGLYFLWTRLHLVVLWEIISLVWRFIRETFLFFG